VTQKAIYDLLRPPLLGSDAERFRLMKPAPGERGRLAPAARLGRHLRPNP